ncbi:MAG: methionyl-tRNA formyltransferase [Alphaproteobacteria bacterium]
MRIVLNGQQAFGKAVLDALIERGEQVVAVYCPPDRDDGRADPVKDAALAHGIELRQRKSFKDDDAVEELKALSPDLCVMAFVTAIVPSAFLNAPRLGSIQYHPSLLPRHRGPSSINWPIIQGETRTGLSIFWPDDGWDTGPVLLQKDCEIGPDDTLGSVYFNHLFPMGVEAMLEAVDLVRDGKAPRIEQDETLATYESWCRAEDAEIDWRAPSGTVHDLIRGANPQPGAWTMHGDERLQIFDCQLAPDITGAPGEIMALDADGMAVAARDGGVLILRARAGRGAKTSPAEIAGLAVGGKLGS